MSVPFSAAARWRLSLTAEFLSRTFCNTCPPHCEGTFCAYFGCILQVLYEFKIYAGDEDGWSDAAAVGPVAPVDPPERPILVRQLSFNQTSVTIAWSMVSSSPPASHFKVSPLARRPIQPLCVVHTPVLRCELWHVSIYHFWLSPPGWYRSFMRSPGWFRRRS